MVSSSNTSSRCATPAPIHSTVGTRALTAPPYTLVQSDALGGLVANFNLFLPGNANDGNKVPLLTYLSGLTCTEDNA